MDSTASGIGLMTVSAPVAYAQSEKYSDKDKRRDSVRMGRYLLMIL